MTLEQYLVFERAAEEKHDFVDGQTVAMAGCTEAHDAVAGNVQRLLGNALAGRPGACRPFTSDMKLYIPATGGTRYPDASVACEPAYLDGTRDALVNPCVIVEVLSRSTEATDRGDKFVEYRSIPSFNEYVLVSQHRVLVEHYIRQADGTWTLRILPAGETLRLSCAPIEVPVNDLYLWVNLP
jgi:Uma2 family endonuclease